ncbi:MAG: RIP metalloprotease RseP [Synechococcales cyanobacterium]
MSVTSIVSVLAAVGVLALLIMVHEAGHFAAARFQGIHATRFSIGFGPALWRYQGSRTEYALRLLPLGGYVGFPDDDEESPYDPQDPDLLKNRPILDRAVVLSAGVLANLLFAYLALVVMVTATGIMVTQVHPGIMVPQVTLEGAAADAGMKPGDVILAASTSQQRLDFEALNTPGAASTAIQQLQTLVQQGSPLTFTVSRPSVDQPLTLQVVPRIGETVPVIGVGLGINQETLYQPAHNPQEVLREAARIYEQIVQMNVRGLTQLVTNFGRTAGQLAGPVGIVKIGADIAQSGSLGLFHFAALISINLAILNLLPLPALDGGHLVFLILEAMRGKRLPRHLEERVMQTGLVFFLGLGVVLILKDTVTIAVGAG